MAIHLYDKKYYVFSENKTYQELPLEYITETNNENNIKTRLSFYEEGEYICSLKQMVQKANDNFYRFNDLLPEDKKDNFTFEDADEELLYQLYAKNSDVFIGSLTTIHKKERTIMSYIGNRILLAFNKQYFDPLEQKIYDEFNLAETFDISSDKTKKTQKKEYCMVTPLYEKSNVKNEMTKMTHIIKKAVETLKDSQHSNAKFVRRRDK